MAVEYFAAAKSKPEYIFCDTSFILDVLTDEVSGFTALLGQVPEKRTRARESAAFFHAYRSHGAQFVSSPFTFSEVGYAISRRVCSGQRQNSWKTFMQADRAACLRVHRATMRLIYTAWQRIQRYDIWFTFPLTVGVGPLGLRVEPEVVEAANLLRLKYVTLDWADAYHIAVGLACGVQWFATTDRHWKDVADINVFCDA